MIREAINLLGLKGHDKITGFCGVVSSVSFDIGGCCQLWLAPPFTDKSPEGKPTNGMWFDAARIEFENPAFRVMEVPDFQRMARKPAEFQHGAEEKGAPR